MASNSSSQEGGICASKTCVHVKHLTVQAMHYTAWPPLAPPPLAGGGGNGPAGDRPPEHYNARVPPRQAPACVHVVIAGRTDFEWAKQHLEVRWRSPYMNGKPVDLTATIRQTVGFHIQSAVQETQIGISYSMFRRFPDLSLHAFKRWIMEAMREEGRAVVVLRDATFVVWEPDAEPPAPPPGMPPWEPDPEVI